MKIGQVALGFGADDMGSVMIEENVVSAAGTTLPHVDRGARPPDQARSARRRCSATRSTARSRSGTKAVAPLAVVRPSASLRVTGSLFSKGEALHEGGLHYSSARSRAHALLYVTTAVGGQQAGPSRAEFNALKKQVATLKRDDPGNPGCPQRLLHVRGPGCQLRRLRVPGCRRLDPSSRPHSTLPRPAKHRACISLDVGQACASVINTAKLNVHLKVIRPAATRR